jgi:copper chaperone CopZ
MADGTTATAGDIHLRITGMTCGSCVGRVERALKDVRGVTGAEVNLATGSARITGTPDLREIAAALDAVGYPRQRSRRSCRSRG